jgi:hypothetical protein
VTDQQAPPGSDETTTAPVTGIAQVDDATRALSSLSELPVSEHHGRLATAQAALDAALDSDRPGAPD